MSQDSQERRSPSSLYPQLDITASGQPVHALPPGKSHEEQTELLRDVLSALDRNNELLEEMVAAMGATQKQRVQELNQWKQANPRLSTACRNSAEALSRVQVEFLNRMTEEINDTVEEMMDGDFMLNEFIDRFGPRLAHLNGVIQVLAQLSSIPNPTDTSGT